jgi:hypothetical protein
MEQQTTELRGVKPEEPKLVFVVGLWRSGTSLLHALLNQHPQIAVMYEAEPMDLWPFRRGLLGAGRWPLRLECFNQTLSRHGLDERLLASARPGCEAALSLYRQFASRRAGGARIFGEKAPAYHTRLRLLGRFFPDALFVIVWRDPLACCRSAARAANKNRFFAQRGMMPRILFGASTLARGVEALQRHQVRLHEVVYEELLKDTEGELRRLCDFLGVPFAPEMVNLKAADVSTLPSGEHHAGVRSGVIGKQAEAADPLPAEFTCKCHRYSVLWRQQFSKLGFARALPVVADAAVPGPLERLSGSAENCFWRMLDCCKRVVFRHIPLAWWTRLRAALPRAQAPSKATP